jgi:hypothetical protein
MILVMLFFAEISDPSRPQGTLVFASALGRMDSMQLWRAKTREAEALGAADHGKICKANGHSRILKWRYCTI